MARPMIYPMGTMEIGDVATMPADAKGSAKKTSRNVSQYSIRHGKCFKCRTDVVKGLTFITRLG
jgi:hypothetical protein